MVFILMIVKRVEKKHIDENSPYVYSGTIEYYWPFDIPNSYTSMCFTIKENVEPKNVPCTIKIHPYKTYPQTFYVFYNNKGFAISLCYST